MFDADKLSSIASSVRAGHYNLLLGAGVSLDSKNSRGEFLPSGDRFRLDLCKLKGARETSSLQRVYSTLTESEIQEQVIDRFSKCIPGPTLEKFTKFIWRRIFTFNIDDALEVAYQSSDSPQDILSFHFSDDYVEIRERSTVPIIHLHGWVRLADRGFVFSASEYVRQIRVINPWMVVLSQFLPIEPFIIAGTSLDEVDLEYYLSHRSQGTARNDRGPSIMIEPFPDAVTRKDCEKFDMLLFEGTAEKFLDYLEEKIPDRVTPLELVPPQCRDLFPSGSPPRTVISFAADFELIPPDTIPNNTPSRFLYGHSPTWEDLAGNLDISRGLTGRFLKEIEDSFDDDTLAPAVFLLLEDTGAGKTTVVRRIGYELATRGRVVLFCSALSRIDPQRTAEAIDLIDDPLLIIVDDFADQAPAIADTLLRMEKRDVVTLCAERKYRWRYLKTILSEIDFRVIEGLNLSGTESDGLINLYLRFGLLGTSEAVTDKKGFSQRISSDPIAVASCRILNDFRPLDRIVKSISAAANKIDRERYLIAALAQFCFRGGVRYEVLASISGRDGWNHQFSSLHPLPLAYSDQGDHNYIVPMNATLSGRILDLTSNEDSRLLCDVFSRLANAIAPRVNRAAIMRRAPEARLAGRLFDYDQVVNGFLGDLSDLFYSAARDAWRWNSRYWEQVALLSLSQYRSMPEDPEGREALAMAVQHARHAVSIETHPFPLTTLGKVLLVQMMEREFSARENFEEAFLRLTFAIDLERKRSRVNVHAFITLFRGARDYIAMGEELTGKQTEKIKELMTDAERKFRRDAELQQAIAEIKDYFA